MDTNSKQSKCCICSVLDAPWLSSPNLGLFILRWGVGALMLTHGIPKLIMLLGGEGGAWLDPLGIGSTLSLTLAMLAELGCSILLIAGFLTRLASLVLIVNFAVIVFVFDPATKWGPSYELGVVYLIAYVVLFLTGAGKWSMDHYLRIKADSCKL